MLILFTGSLHFLYLELIDAACKELEALVVPITDCLVYRKVALYQSFGVLRTEGELFKEFKMQLMVLLISQET